VDIFKNTKVDDRFFIPAKILNSAISDVNKYYIVKIDQYSVQKVERTKTTALGMFKLSKFIQVYIKRLTFK